MMETEGDPTRARRATLGYSSVLLGATLFVISCFLPYEGTLPPARTASLYDLSVSGPSGGSDLGALLVLFGGVATVAAVALVAIMRGERNTSLSFLLIGAVAAWALTWIGSLLRIGTFGGSLKIGFWLQAVSIGVVVIGTFLVTPRRPGAHERRSQPHDADAS